MKQTVGAGVVVAIAMAAVRMAGPAPQVAPVAGVSAVVPVARPHQEPPAQMGTYRGGCTAFDAGEKGESYPHDANRGAAKSVLDGFFGIKPEQPESASLGSASLASVRYVLALAPDPKHTHLSLSFDREMVMVQQAAQDEGYTFNSSWLPWKDEASNLALLQDQQRMEDETSHREACPGVLLFRKSVEEPDPSAAKIAGADYIAATPKDPYAEALVVFVVGEQPTGGLNEEQWSNAIHWLAVNAPVAEKGHERALGILGPTFSGSLVSMARDLGNLFRDESGGPDARNLSARFSRVHLLSGGITGCTSIRWFQRRMEEPQLENRITFGTFAENDELQIYRFMSFVHGQGGRLKDVTILSEDETAYALANGTASKAKVPAQASSVPPCAFPYPEGDRPVKLSYPRDISAIRTAYEKQSVFTGPGQAARTAHPILQENAELDAENANVSDTIHAYSGAMSAVAQEGVLYGIVSNLRVHHTRYLMLRCSNSLDFLFLTRFFHRAYPQARIVTVTSDLLFRREIDTTEFRGVLALANYPLLPTNQHWSRLSEEPVHGGAPPPAHTHRIFESNAEGPYIAGRYLFHEGLDWSKAESPQAAQPYLTLPLIENIPDYGDPYWMHKPDEAIKLMRAPVWLSVLGRDGYWPVAVLGDSTPGIALPGPNLASTMVHLESSKGAHYDLVDDLADASLQKPQPGRQFKDFLAFGLPLAWKICVILALGLVGYQLFAVVRGSSLSSSGLFAPFRQIDDRPSHGLLLGINCAFACMLPYLLTSVIVPLPSLSLLGDGSMDLWLTIGVTVCMGCALVAALFYRHDPSARTIVYAGSVAAICFLAVFMILSGISALTLHGSAGKLDGASLFYRMGHVTSGVSPLTPMLFLFSGMYLWTWQALAGSALLADGRPLLPAFGGEQRTFGWLNRVATWARKRPLTKQGGPDNTLGATDYRISEEVAKRIVNIASPLCLDAKVVALPAMMFLGACFIFLTNLQAPDLPLLGMEGRGYAMWINLILFAAFLLTTAEAARLYHTWIELRRLLLALNRRPLRRTFAKLRDIGPGSLWSVSGNVQRVQFQLFSQQLEAGRRLLQLDRRSLPNLERALQYAHRFSINSATRISAGSRWEKPVQLQPGGEKLYIRQLLADAVAELMNTVLEPGWKIEDKSLNLECGPSKDDGEAEQCGFDIPLSEDAEVKTAEELVCLHYIAFIQNILARMRTMTLSMVSLFVAVCLSISFYPFVPRTEIGMWMVLNLALIAAAVVYVYAGMERDVTLSYITNTKPGRLSTEFYIKTAGFLAGPVLGLLTTQFPAISESILGWLQPGLDAIK